MENTGVVRYDSGKSGKASFLDSDKRKSHATSYIHHPNLIENFNANISVKIASGQQQ